MTDSSIPQNQPHVVVHPRGRVIDVVYVPDSSIDLEVRPETKEVAMHSRVSTIVLGIDEVKVLIELLLEAQRTLETRSLNE